MSDHTQIFDEAYTALKQLMKDNPNYGLELERLCRLFEGCHSANGKHQIALVKRQLKYFTDVQDVCVPDSLFTKQCAIWVNLITPFVEDFDKELAA